MHDIGAVMSPAATKAPRRGRPRKAEEVRLQDEFLDHCMQQFLSAGYHGTTMDQLARSFGASKSTLYLRYGSKIGLLRAAMERAEPLLRTPLEAVDADPGRNPREVLRDFGGVLLRHSADPRIRALWSAVIEATNEVDDLVLTVAEGTTRTLAPLAGYFQQMNQAGALRLADPWHAAATFTEMVTGGLSRYMRGPFGPPEGAAALEMALDLFLRGAEPRAGDS